LRMSKSSRGWVEKRMKERREKEGCVGEVGGGRPHRQKEVGLMGADWAATDRTT
jgi:hypothetical protein